MWDLSGGGYLDEFITYSREQPKEFFDPEAFEDQLKDPSNTETNLMYMFLKDPGGKSFPTPGS